MNTEICVVCGKKFIPNKYATNQICCGKICMKKYKNLYNKTRSKLIRSTPEGIARDKARQATPEYNKRRRALFSTPEGKARHLKRVYSKNKHCKCGILIRNKSKTCLSCVPMGRYKRIEYKGYLMMGTWEPALAKFLDNQGIKWQYSPKEFQFKNFKYTPDFYIPETDTYIEVKGYWHQSKKKYTAFTRKYGNIILLNKQKFKEFGILI